MGAVNFPNFADAPSFAAFFRLTRETGSGQIISSLRKDLGNDVIVVWFHSHAAPDDINKVHAQGRSLVKAK